MGLIRSCGQAPSALLARVHRSHDSISQLLSRNSEGQTLDVPPAGVALKPAIAGASSTESQHPLALVGISGSTEVSQESIAAEVRQALVVWEYGGNGATVGGSLGSMEVRGRDPFDTELREALAAWATGHERAVLRRSLLRLLVQLEE
jgi:hypothetical protein